jgi:hypothetical protein
MVALQGPTTSAGIALSRGMTLGANNAILHRRASPVLQAQHGIVRSSACGVRGRIDFNACFGTKHPLTQAGQSVQIGSGRLPQPSRNVL